MGLESGHLQLTRNTTEVSVFDATSNAARARGVFSIAFGGAVLGFASMNLLQPRYWVFAAMLLVPGLLFLREGFRALREKRRIEVDHALEKVRIVLGDDVRTLKISRIAALEVMRPAKDQARIPAFSPVSLVSILLKNKEGVAVEASLEAKQATELASKLRSAINPRLEIFQREWDVELARKRQPHMHVPPAWVGVVAIHSVSLLCAAWLIQSGMEGELLIARGLSLTERWICFASAAALPMLGEALRRWMRSRGAFASPLSDEWRAD